MRGNHKIFNPMLKKDFFDRDPQEVAKYLLGKVIRHKQNNVWLSAMIIETEAYYIHEKGSHSSLGFTEKRKALFMPAGTIYMYYSHGGDSLNISCHGEGNAVLVKSGMAYEDKMTPKNMIEIMRRLNPLPSKQHPRPAKRLCSGQTLLCKSLGLKVPEWNQKSFNKNQFYIEDVHYAPAKIIQTTRLGIPTGRDEHLHYRFIDYDYAAYCTSNPLTKRNWNKDIEYKVILYK